ncbi:transglycosylase domain-containing protein [Streptomyces corynorhini]|uniref:Penicillin-binding protein n=1 Tax=Streptomyces corynorhini TaxID=2282652 RepID=A0A370B9B2_9ACTN|nr:transglycosylase domain-containing protein [Streptomyces corynorhini]RDG36969.1 penicillin-binding protein [Streptomyces corynorhini]
MSEHRRKPSQPQGGGRAAARRAAQQSSGRRAAPSRESTASPSGAHDGEEPAFLSRADARRAAQRGGRRGGGGGDGSGRGRGEPGKKRLIDYPRHNKDGWQRWMPSWKQTTGLGVAFVGSILLAGTVSYALVQVPDQNLASKAENNVYYWDDGTQLAATGGSANRQVIGIAQIPAAMQNAVISAENKSFRKDPGVDFMGMGRALYNMAMGGNTQGGSTITQQYVKNARLGDQSQTLDRKYKELFISMKVGSKMKKPAIMEGYLNTSYYGRGAWGIQAAARTYYGKDAEKLNPSECAFLASLLKGATLYDPAGNPGYNPNATAAKNTDRAKKRWAWILGEMVKDGHLDAAQRDKYTEFPMPKPVRQSDDLGGQIGYLVDLAKANFINNNTQGLTVEDLSKGGYEIHTTFNKNKVAQLEKAVSKVKKANIDPKARPKTDTHVQFGGASVAPDSGKIVAIYGGEDATKHYTNNADQTGAQVGSTFKPFVLAAAMQHGKRDPSLGPDQSDAQRTLVSPDKSVYNGDNKLKIKNYDGSVWTNEEDKEWLQRNDGDKSYGPIDLREAMRESANSPFVQLGMDVGISTVRDVAIAAGLRDDETLSKSNVPSFSIGVSSPSAIRMAGSYATFAASGKQNDPYSVTKVLKRGKPIYEHDGKEKTAFSAQIADNVTDVLKTVVEKGTGTSAKLEGRQVAGKTGTTDGNKSAWFVGYTPQLSTAIDMYRLDDDESNKDRKFEEMFGTGGQDKIHGASFPAEIWQDYMKEALKGEKALPFPKPEPIGEAVYGGGAASPEPSPSESPDESPSESVIESPSESVTESPADSPSPDPSESCKKLFGCDDNGGNNQGNDNGGVTGDPSPSTSESEEENGGADGGGGGGDGTGFFAGTRG